MHEQAACADAAAGPPVPRAVLQLVWQGRAAEAAAACRSFPAIRAALQRELEASTRTLATPPTTFELPGWATDALAAWHVQGPAMQLKGFACRSVSDAGCANQTQLSLKLSERDRREVVRRLEDLSSGLPPGRHLLRLVLADGRVAGPPPPSQPQPGQRQHADPAAQREGEEGPLLEVREHDRQAGKRRAFYLVCSKLPRTDRAALAEARRRHELLAAALRLADPPQPASGAEQAAAGAEQVGVKAGQAAAVDSPGQLEQAAPAPAADDAAALPATAPALGGGAAPPARQRRPLAPRNPPAAAAGAVPSKRLHTAAAQPGGEENAAAAAPVSAARAQRRAAAPPGEAAATEPSGTQAGRRARSSARMPR